MNNQGFSNFVIRGITKYVINITETEIAMMNLIEYGTNSISVKLCIWGTKVSRRKEMTGIVTITILYRGGEIKGLTCDDFSK
ncbi:MAG: hypothetical protein ACRD8W_07290 [Nitrososphaeraceae archaeon]